MQENKSLVSNMKKGNRLSELQHYEVIDIRPDMVDLKNERGLQLSVSIGIVQEGMYSATQYTSQKEITRTELIEVFSQCYGAVLTVCFNKQPKAEDINNAIESANKGKIIPIADLKKLVKNAYKGEERILTGYLIKVETGFGRSMVIDLEADASKSTTDWDARIRQVDHRSLNWLIFKNVMYSVKK